MYEILMSLAVLILFVEIFIFQFEIRKLEFKLNKIISKQFANQANDNTHEVGKALKSIMEKVDYREK